MTFIPTRPSTKSFGFKTLYKYICVSSHQPKLLADVNLSGRLMISKDQVQTTRSQDKHLLKLEPQNKHCFQPDLFGCAVLPQIETHTHFIYTESDSSLFSLQLSHTPAPKFPYTATSLFPGLLPILRLQRILFAQRRVGKSCKI